MDTSPWEKPYMKRIVFVSYTFWPPDFGGELILSIERFQALTRRGFEITVLTSGRKSEKSRELLDGLQICRSPGLGSKRIARLIRRIVYVFWAFRYVGRLPMDILYLGDTAGIGPVTTAILNWIFCGISKIRGARSVAVHSLADSETSSFNTQGWNGLWRRLQLEPLDRIVAISPTLYQSLIPSFPDKIVYIPNGIRDDIFIPMSPDERARFRIQNGIKPNDIIYLFLGSIGFRKGFDLLASVFSENARKNPRWQLWIIGPRTSKESQNLNEHEVNRVSSTLNDPHLANKVKFWGRINNRQQLRLLLASGDIFVFPSRREGMGLAPMEAMAVGTPVIITRLPGITDLASIEGKTGLYVKPGDIHSLKWAMEWLAEHPQIRKRMGCQSVHHVRHQFGWQRHIDNWVAFLL
jgi:glycosyltransferase involved in cell wall biosynthesis